MRSFGKDPKTHKIKGLSVLPLVLSGIIGAGAIAGTATSIWYMSKNYQESAEFSKSFLGRIEVDTLANNKEEAEDHMKQAAEKLSAWLKDNSQPMYDVTYETYEEEGIGNYKGYLSAQFNVDKVRSKRPFEEDDETKYDNDPYLSFFEKTAINSNRKTLVYRWYTPLKEDRPMFSIVDLDKCFIYPKSIDQEDSETKILANADGKWGVMYHVSEDTDNQFLLNAIYNDMLKAYEATQDKPDPENEDEKPEDWQLPRLYVINNIEQMFNEANYQLLNYRFNMDEEEGSDRTNYLRLYQDTASYQFVQEYTTGKDDQGVEAEGSTRQNTPSLLPDQLVTSLSGTSGDPMRVAESSPNINLLRWLDFTPGSNKFVIFNKYVEDIITVDQQKFKDYFPAKITDMYKQDVASTSADWESTNIVYFWHPYSDKLVARKYLNQLISYQLPVKFVQVQFQNETETVTKFNKFKKSFGSIEVQPKFVDSIFGGSALVGWLTLGFLIFLIGLGALLAALYRMTGVISWICLMFMLSMTQLIASLSTFVISMPFLFGLFTLSLIGFMAALGICERMKRKLNSNEDTQVIVNKTFKKSLLPLVDFSIITLLFGICFTYIAPASLNILGLILIIGGFALFIIMYLMNGGLHLLLFKNSITNNRHNLFGKKTNLANQALTQGNNLVPSSVDTGKLEFDYYSSMSRKNIKLFDKRTFIALAVLVGILIVGIVIFSVFGLTTNTLFHTPAQVMIYYDGDLLSQDWFMEAGLSYTSYIRDGNWWYFSITSLSGQEPAISALAEHLSMESQLLVQLFFGSTNQDALMLALVSIVVGSALSSVYGAIRYNWASLVPMILGTMVMPILMLSIASICQVKFDQIVVLGFILTSIVNCLMTANILSTIQDAWSRQDAYTREEFRFIISTALKNNWQYLWVFASGFAFFIFCFALTSPFGSGYLSLIIFLGALVTIFATPVSVAYVEYYLLCGRNNILGYRAEKAKDKVIINLDEIDEQSIEGINKFTKQKEIPIIERGN